jgi:hypothetical protein
MLTSSAALYPGATQHVAEPVETSDTTTVLVRSSSACLRGLRYGIAIELAAAAMLYGLWRLVHLL